MHSMYSGSMEKAIKYSEKALLQVQRLKGEHVFQFQMYYYCNCCTCMLTCTDVHVHAHVRVVIS